MNLKVDDCKPITLNPPPIEMSFSGYSSVDLHGCYYCFYRGDNSNTTYLYEYHRSFGAVPLKLFNISFPDSQSFYEEGVRFRVTGIVFDAESEEPSIAAQWDGPASSLQEGKLLELELFGSK